jgi:hypothetical protein
MPKLYKLKLAGENQDGGKKVYSLPFGSPNLLRQLDASHTQNFEIWSS